MTAPQNLKRIISGALLSGGVAMAVLGLDAGAAQAYPQCTGNGTCATQWCPGQRLPAPDVNWDMIVCHDWLGHPYPGTTQVGANTWEGNPCEPGSFGCTPRRVPS